MSDSAGGGRPQKRSRFLLNRPGQSTIAWRLAGILAGVCLLYATAVWFLVGSDLVQGASIAEMRRLLLGVHAAYFVIGGGILLITTLLLTHRYAGPALVMERAVAAMRRGDYDEVLSTRDKDFLKSLTAELSALRDEMRTREERREEMLERLQAGVEAGDVTVVRAILEDLRRRTTSAGRTASSAAA